MEVYKGVYDDLRFIILKSNGISINISNNCYLNGYHGEIESILIEDKIINIDLTNSKYNRAFEYEGGIFLFTYKASLDDIKKISLHRI